MKLFLRVLFSIILFVYSNQIWSQKIILDELDLKSILCKKWIVEKMNINGEFSPVNEESGDAGFEFHRDNTFGDFPNGKKLKVNTWKYDKNKGIVELYYGNELIGEINTIDENRLIFVAYIPKDIVTSYKKIDIYCKPLN